MTCNFLVFSCIVYFVHYPVFRHNYSFKYFEISHNAWIWRLSIKMHNLVVKRTSKHLNIWISPGELRKNRPVSSVLKIYVEWSFNSEGILFKIFSTSSDKTLSYSLYIALTVLFFTKLFKPPWWSTKIFIPQICNCFAIVRTIGLNKRLLK